MFFKKKKKIDSKLRFEQINFKRDLARARSFKRNSKPIQLDTSWLSWKRLVYLLIILAVLSGSYYIVFIPNPLFIKTIEITGLQTEPEKDNAKQHVNNFLNEKTLKILPKKNTLFLETKELKKYLTDNEPKIYQVTSIEKQWTKQTIKIQTVPRTYPYSLETGEGAFVVSNDGKVIKRLEPGEETPDKSTRIVFLAGKPEINNMFIPEQILFSLDYLIKNLPATVDAGIDYFEFPADSTEQGKKTLPRDEIFIYTSKDNLKKYPTYKIIFATNSDLPATLENLKLLLSETAQERLHKIAYIDLRFKNRGFMCLQNTECSKPPEPSPIKEEGDKTETPSIPKP